ncbi:MAG: ABC transporter permease, partial [Deltaproteobacteria bacterium]|nr:ABC transporter permease [Deltaproteobacteria bacterium]
MSDQDKHVKDDSLVLKGMSYVGGLVYLSKDFFRQCFTRYFPFRELIKQIESVGVQSLTLTSLIALFTGLVIAVQFIVGLERFGLQLYTGQIVGIAITRELGPVLTALMVAARVGAGITAEIGSMNVTEQVMAIEALGASPVKKLVVPRVLACILCTPILTVLADIIGILGSLVISVSETGVETEYFMDQIFDTVRLIDFGSGLAKTVFFGFFIGIVVCYLGLITWGG